MSPGFITKAYKLSRRKFLYKTDVDQFSNNANELCILTQMSYVKTFLSKANIEQYYGYVATK